MAALEADLAAALSARLAAEAARDDALTEAEERAALLAQANTGTWHGRSGLGGE
jgi:hypothetical protein